MNAYKLTLMFLITFGSEGDTTLPGPGHVVDEVSLTSRLKEVEGVKSTDIKKLILIAVATRLLETGRTSSSS